MSVGRCQGLPEDCHVVFVSSSDPRHCQKAATVIDNRMALLEEKVSVLKEADMTLDHVVIMNEVASNLEAVQKSMGTVEEYQATIDNLMDLDETLKAGLYLISE